jgi:hypothetical protein
VAADNNGKMLLLSHFAVFEEAKMSGTWRSR